eukprot:gene45499-62643_t
MPSYPGGTVRWWDYIPPTPWEMPTTMNPPVTMAYAAVDATEQA